MQISLSKPESCCEIGKRDNKEDYVYHNSALYIVCDGVGGSARGEIASQYSAETIANYFQKHFKGFQTPENIVSLCQNAVSAAVEALQKHLETHPESRGLATTLALLHFHEGGATIAHVGDSRVYHYRPNENLFATEDHSLVMDLLKAGWITPEEVPNHPRRNVITRAIQVGKTVQPQVQIITDIQKGDCFFLCSDGILESFTDEELTALFAEKISNAQKMAKIQQKCVEFSKDNYSCILLQVSDVKGALQGESHFPMSTIEIEAREPNMVLEREVTWIDSPEMALDTPPALPATTLENTGQTKLTEVKKESKKKENLILIGWITLASLLIYAAFGGKSEPNKPPPRKPASQPQKGVTPTSTATPAPPAPATTSTIAPAPLAAPPVVQPNSIPLDTAKKKDSLKNGKGDSLNLFPNLNLNQKIGDGLPTNRW